MPPGENSLKFSCETQVPTREVEMLNKKKIFKKGGRGTKLTTVILIASSTCLMKILTAAEASRRRIKGLLN